MRSVLLPMLGAIVGFYLSAADRSAFGLIAGGLLGWLLQAVSRLAASERDAHKQRQEIALLQFRVDDLEQRSQLAEPPILAWDAARALQSLAIEEIPFTHTDGNCLGYARERSIAINPVNPLPHKTRFHELAHVLLGHTAEGEQADTEITPRSLRECEAEAVALVCCAALELPGVAECRGYIQSWWGEGREIPERSAQRVLKAADQILKAGQAVEVQA